MAPIVPGLMASAPSLLPPPLLLLLPLPPPPGAVAAVDVAVAPAEGEAPGTAEAVCEGEGTSEGEGEGGPHTTGRPLHVPSGLRRSMMGVRGEKGQFRNVTTPTPALESTHPLIPRAHTATH